MKQYAIGLITGGFLILSAVMFLGATESDQHDGRYQFIGGSTVDMKVFDTRTGKFYMRGRDFVTEYDIINSYYQVHTYKLYGD